MNRLDGPLDLLRRGAVDEACEQFRRLVQAEPRNAEAHNWSAVALARARRLDEAAAASQRALALAPGNASFYLTAANVQQDLRNLPAAVELLQAAVRLHPSFAEGYNNLGIVLTDLGRFDEALAAFESALRHKPDYARAWANLAAARLRAMEPDLALEAATRAVALQPGYAHAHHLAGNALVMRGDTAAAEPRLTEALRLKPDFTEASLLLAKVLLKLKRRDDAERVVRQALAVSPDRKELWLMQGDLAAELDDLGNAMAAYQRASALAPDDLASAVRAALLLPNIYASEAHLAACRQKITEGINALYRDTARLAAGMTRERLGEAMSNSFLLAYQGGNDRDLQRTYADFVRGVVRHVLPDAPACVPASATGRRIRIGFCSRFFYLSTAGNYFASWITDLDRNRFEVFVFHTHIANDALTARIRAAADHFKQAEENFSLFAKEIRDAKLDVLVYPEVGMDRVTYLLASLRLAPVQVSAWGHPITPGHAAIDHYLSCASMEPPDAAQHYNEPLLLLPGIGTRYERPRIDAAAAAKSRADFQLPDDAHLYLFPQSLFKVHPANDRLVVRVLAGDPKGVLVMFGGQNAAITQRFVNRLAAEFAAQGVPAQGRVKILPGLLHDDYKRVNQLCDVMLDTLHWSGGNTSLDALAMGLPIVTLPGAYMRGRQTMAMLAQMGLDELIAKTPDEYVATAQRVAADPSWRQALSQRILAGHARLFDDLAPPAAFARHMLALAGAAP